MIFRQGSWLFLWAVIFCLFQSAVARADIDTGSLTPLDGSVVDTQVGYQSFNRRTGVTTYTASLTNVSGATVQGPLYLAVESITQNISVTNADDVSTNGDPLLQFDSLAPGESRTRTLAFSNPQRVRLSFTPVLYAAVAEDLDPPEISIAAPPDGAVVTAETVTVTGMATDETELAGVTVNGVPATVSGDTYSASVPLAPGSNTITATATDTSGNTASTSISVTRMVTDITPPMIDIGSPEDGAVITESTVLVSGTATDNQSLDGVTVNGVPATVSGDSYSASVPLAPGSNTITAVATDSSGNSASQSISVTRLITDLTPPMIDIGSPANGAVVPVSPVLVSGTATDNQSLDGVTVNGVAATISGDTYTASVPLAVGSNTITATARDTSGNTASMSIGVTFTPSDDLPPEVSINSPVGGAVIETAAVTVSGTVSDNAGLDNVRVNGVLATISGNSYSAGVPLVEGPNTITAVATDNAGNQSSASVNVTRAVISVEDTPPDINVLTPVPQSIVNEDTVNVTGTVIDEGAVTAVTVNGAAAARNGTGFSSTVGLAEGINPIAISATDDTGNTTDLDFTVTRSPATEDNPPQLSISSPTEGQIFPAETGSVLVAGTATDDTAIWQVSVNGLPANLDNESFSNNVALSEGANTLTVVARDTSGNETSATVNVEREMQVVVPDPPSIVIRAPSRGGVVVINKPVFKVEYSSPAGIDNTTLAFMVNNSAITVDCIFQVSSANCTPQLPLIQGPATLKANVLDNAGKAATDQVSFSVDLQPVEISITSPEDGLITGNMQVGLTGTVGTGVTAVKVNEVDAVVSGGGFTATVPLREGINMLVAVGTKASGRTGTDSVDVTYDAIAPIVRIDTPVNNFMSVNNTLDVAGKVNDIVNGATEARVTVNGIEATVSAGSFVVINLPLKRGANVIEAVATDFVGNVGRHSINVNYQPPVGARMTVASGNGQFGVIKQLLPNPLITVVKDGLGNPVAGRVVRFEVSRNNGLISTAAGSPGMRTVQVVTNGAGQASVLLKLGDTTGEGNNRVKASSVGVAGVVEFCASSLNSPPEKILMVSGDNQRGVTGHPLATPLEALVVDTDGNPSKGVEVTFSVVGGGGNLNGNSELVKTTGIDGIARTVLTLGPEAGINNNVVRASFPGLTGLAASFVASAVTPGKPEETRFSGVVLDNGLSPIPGAVVTIPGSEASDTTDEEGQFLLENVPVGHIHLRIDPSGSPRPEDFPPLEFETVTIAGQVNVLGQPILIPAVDNASSKIVGGDEDVTISMEGVAGLELTVFANSATCLDGSFECRVSISQVHLDKVPMPPPSGTIFMPPAWTIQPAGTRFDPPARISIPNDGLPPGRVIDIFQFDHGLNEFINVGKGTVSEDASVIVSDPGFGVTRAGWGGCGQPQPPNTCTCGCDDRDECTTDSCSGQPTCACTNAPLADNTACAENSFCKDAGMCMAGKCDGKTKPGKEDQQLDGETFQLGAINNVLQKVQEFLGLMKIKNVTIPKFEGELSFSRKRVCCEEKQGQMTLESTGGGTLKLPFWKSPRFVPTIPPWSGDWTVTIFGKTIGGKYGIFVEADVAGLATLNRTKRECQDDVCWSGDAGVDANVRGGVFGNIPNPALDPMCGPQMNMVCSIIRLEGAGSSGLNAQLSVGCDKISGKVGHNGLKIDGKFVVAEGTWFEFVATKVYTPVDPGTLGSLEFSLPL